jgi:hypothetical protein
MKDEPPLPLNIEKRESLKSTNTKEWWTEASQLSTEVLELVLLGSMEVPSWFYRGVELLLSLPFSSFEILKIHFSFTMSPPFDLDSLAARA